MMVKGDIYTYIGFLIIISIFNRIYGNNVQPLCFSLKRHDELGYHANQFDSVEYENRVWQDTY